AAAARGRGRIAAAVVRALVGTRIRNAGRLRCGRGGLDRRHRNFVDRAGLELAQLGLQVCLESAAVLAFEVAKLVPPTLQLRALLLERAEDVLPALGGLALNGL